MAVRADDVGPDVDLVRFLEQPEVDRPSQQDDRDRGQHRHPDETGSALEHEQPGRRGDEEHRREQQRQRRRPERSEVVAVRGSARGSGARALRPPPR